MAERFVMLQSSDYAALLPLLPAQSALAFVLEAETWPVFRAWLQRKAPADTTDAQDRADLEQAFSALIKITRSVRRG